MGNYIACTFCSKLVRIDVNVQIHAGTNVHVHVHVQTAPLAI